jgi:hypothetical protein
VETFTTWAAVLVAEAAATDNLGGLPQIGTGAIPH